MRRLALVTTAAALTAACMSAHDIGNARGEGETRCYVAPYDLLWPAAEGALRSLGLVVERANRDEGVLVARTYRPEEEDPEDMALETRQGERVAIFLELDSRDAASRPIWTIEVVSRPIFALDPSARDWTRPVFLALEGSLPDSATSRSDDLAACTRVNG